VLLHLPNGFDNICFINRPADEEILLHEKDNIRMQCSQPCVKIPTPPHVCFQYHSLVTVPWTVYKSIGNEHKAKGAGGPEMT